MLFLVVGTGYSGKALGLGVGAGFLGGALIGTAASVATLGVYHRYPTPSIQLQYVSRAFHKCGSGSCFLRMDGILIQVRFQSYLLRGFVT